MLLCELHAHTTWSDGELTVRELVDLYGSAGFDVLCVTDHLLRPEAMHPGARAVDAADWHDYADTVAGEAERARIRYGMLVLCGLELTYDDPEPDLAAHVVAVGLDRLVTLEHGLGAALREARGAGAALIAAHPHGEAADPNPGRTTRRWYREQREARALVDRFEAINRMQAFPWVVEAGLPVVASGDAHGPQHLATWKTLIACERTPEAVVGHLRSDRAVSLTPFAARDAAAAGAAAA